MHKSTCLACSAEFDSKRPSKACSRKCRDKMRGGGVRCTGCSKLMGKFAESAVEPWCKSCRSAGLNIKHGTSSAYRYWKCRCGVCKKYQNERVREYNARLRERDGVSATTAHKRRKRGISEIPPNCFLCKKPMNRVVDPPVRYSLHSSCRGKAPNWMRRGLDNPRRAKFQEKIEKIALGTNGGDLVWTSGACDWCGDHFVGVGLTCSERCKKNRKWNRRTTSTFHVSPKFRNSIYERDSWTCQICLTPVDINAGTGSNLYPSLDHIVPQSAMLLPDHSAGNLRTVHMLCNAYRRDDALSDDQVREIVLARYPLAS